MFLSLVRYIPSALLNTEWLGRCLGNTVFDLFPLFYLEGIGCYNWGFVAGKYQTYEPWESMWEDYYNKGKEYDFYIDNSGMKYDGHTSLNFSTPYHKYTYRLGQYAVLSDSYYLIDSLSADGRYMHLTEVPDAPGKEAMQKKFSEVKKQVREVRASQKVVNQYYRNMMKTGYVDPQFLDDKN